MRKHPWHDLPWHIPSDQPDQIRFPKGPLRRLALPEYLRSGLATLFWTPLIAVRAASLEALRRPPPLPHDLIGVAVTPGLPWDEALPSLVAELGVRHLLLRAPAWERHGFPRLAAWMRRFPGCDWLVAVLPDRACVCSPPRWRETLLRAFTAFAPLTSDFQIGQAPNRTKWGCYHLGEALDLLEQAELVRSRFPSLRLAGPAVIDFEPLALIRLLMNRRRFRLDTVAALLYVDRRGAPSSRQYGLFDLRRKIACTRAVAALSSRSRGAPLWLTEFNWPIAGTGDYTPTSDDECVDEEEAGRHAADYLRQAAATGLVERAYFWQLVAPGYGLVDPLGAGLRRRPAFNALRELLGRNRWSL